MSAVYDGRVSSRFVASGKQRWGSYDQAARKIKLSEAEEGLEILARLRFHDATKLAHGVLRALSEAAGGELKDIMESLPVEYRELIEKGPGHYSAVDVHHSDSDILNASPR